jgi:hypothetical protein
MKSYDKIFLTGCDEKNAWILPWFMENYDSHNHTPIFLANFGTSLKYGKMMDGNIYVSGEGWFSKVRAMYEASKIADNVCWLDTDCEVREDISGIFDHFAPNKLSMAVDLPWTTRRGEKWHNSGVVGFKGRPSILDEWMAACSSTNLRGDQEVLHEMTKDGIRKMVHIQDLPNEYNVLRLQEIDGTMPDKVKIMHWTGPRGKDHIRSLIND